MKGKLTNLTFVVMLIAGFTLFVAGLERSRGFAEVDNNEPVAAVDEHGTDDGVTWLTDEAVGEQPATAAQPQTRSATVAGRGAVQGAPPTATPTRTPTPINVGNFVWDDIDGDGRQDAGEPGLGGITVQLWNDTKTALLDTTTTNSSGNYTLIAPVPGDYRVRVVISSPDTFTDMDQAGGDDQDDSDINPSGANLGFTDVYTFDSNLISITTIDAGIIIFRTPTPTRTPTPVNIGNFVWDDIDQDGRQDAGEPGLGGYTVQLWNDTMTALLYTTTTNSSGNYTVIAPVPGDYRVRVLLEAGDTFSPKNAAGGDDLLDSDINESGANEGFTDVFNLASNVISTTIVDAGIIKFRTPTPTRTPTPINIGNFVWDDVDEDGIQDAGEPGVEGYQVQLWNAAMDDLIDTDTTNASGAYTVIAPVPGDYRLRVLNNPGDGGFSPKDQGASDQLDSDINPSGVNANFTDAFNLASNVISTVVWDAGIIDPTDPPATPTPTATATPTPTNTPTPTPTADPSVSPTPETPTVTPTPPPGSTPTVTPTATVGPTTTITGGSGAGTNTPAAAVVIPTIRRGATQTGTGSGFIPGEVVTGTQQSTPLSLGTQTADAAGNVTFVWTIRSNETLGTHTFIVSGPSSGSASATFQVTDPSGNLPGTGSNTSTTLLWALAAIVIGVTITFTVARSLKRSEPE